MQYKNVKVAYNPLRKSWWARWQANKVKHTIYGKTQKECYDRLKTALNKPSEKQLNSNLSLYKWVEKWLEVYKINNKETTLKSTKQVLEMYVKNKIGKSILTKLTSLQIQEFLNTISSTKQRLKIYGFLKDCLNKAFENKLIKENLFTCIDKPLHEKKEGKALNQEEEKLFIEKCKNKKYGNFFLILLYQGLRVGELLALNKSDIQNQTITINKALDTMNRISTPKTKSSIRTIPLFQRTAEVVNQIKTERLFTIKRTILQEQFTEITKELKLKGFSMHSLRHTFITRLAEQGITSKLIQKWAGHSTNIITEKVYTHINSDFEQSTFNKIDTTIDTTFKDKNKRGS